MRDRLFINFNRKQADELERLTGLVITNPQEFKQALKILIPSLPEDDKAGRKKPSNIGIQNT